ncbi:MAG: anaerobic ribonucleoside triphosphate reductase, partial [Oscillospiraceae bacterium]|nr:anaerobic ribonucleoside triphosphate reductase [Oscillospiraceae bacterium]
MVTQIIKRDGRKLPFNIEKIANAVYKAAQAVGGSNYDEAMEIARKVCIMIEEVYGSEIPTVEQVQDMVEKVLVEEGHAKTAKAFILYRSNRTRSREMNTRLMKVYEDLTFTSAKDSNMKRDNANIDGDTAMGTMLKYGSEGSKQFYEMYVLDPKHANAHNKGDIHIHDLDFLTLTTTCCQIDIARLFKNGFFTGHGFLREPNSIGSYSALACIAIQSNQNDQHGGQSIPNFDYGLALGVAKTFISEVARISDILFDGKDISPVKEELKSYVTDKEHVLDEEGLAFTEKTLCDKLGVSSEDAKHVIEKALNATDHATYQAMEALIHNLNTMHSRAGAQVPFSSINYGTDTSPEGRMVIKNVLLANEAGLGNGETPIFPIHIFKVKEGVNYNPTDPNYDLFKLACRVSAKRLFPNFSFIDAPYNLQYYKEGDYNTEVSYMGCRTRVIGNNYDKDRQIVTGRGNLSFTSINLPRL